MSQNDLHILALLRRWLRGDATRADEAELEQAARADEWLAEAMEGYRNRPEAKHAERLEALRHRLGQPAKRRPAIFLPGLRIAATVLLLVVAGLAVWYLQSGPPATAELAQNPPISAPDSHPSPQDSQAATSPAAEPLASPLAEDQLAALEAEQSPHSASRSAQASQVEGGRGAPAHIPVDAFSGVFTPAEASSDLRDDHSATQRKRAEQAETGPVSEELSRQAGFSSSAPAAAKAVPSRPPFLSAQGPTLVRGRVTDTQGEALIGANVQVIGQNQGTVTDLDGNFSLQLDSSVQQLLVSYTGFESQRVNLPDHNRELQISLEAGSALNEVVVMGRSAGARRNQVSSQMAVPPQEKPVVTPVIGHRRYERYLRDNWPAGLPAGQVTLSFTILPDGRPASIQVASSTDSRLESPAIRLLEEGGKWTVRHAGLPFYTTYTLKKE